MGTFEVALGLMGRSLHRAVSYSLLKPPYFREFVHGSGCSMVPRELHGGVIRWQLARVCSFLTHSVEKEQ